MRFGVYLADLRRSSNDSHGIINHAVGLVSALPAHLRAGERLVLLYGSELAPELEMALGHPGVEGREVPSPVSIRERLRADHVLVRRWVSAARLDVVHFPKGFIPLVPPRSARVVATVHDDIPIRYRQSTRLRSLCGLQAAYFAWALRHTLRHADQVVTVSEFSRDALAGHCAGGAERIRVIGNGVSIPMLDPVPRRHQQPVLVLLGSPLPHKRSARAIAWTRPFLDAHEQFRLVVTGRLCPAGEEAARHPRIVRKREVLTGAEMAALLRDASALLFPSVVEGFGLPPVEAACLGTPSVWARSSALPGVMGDAPGAFQPDDGASFSTALEQVLALGDERLTELVSSFRGRYSWSPLAARTVAVYREVAGRSPLQAALSAVPLEGQTSLSAGWG